MGELFSLIPTVLVEREGNRVDLMFIWMKFYFTIRVYLKEGDKDDE